MRLTTCELREKFVINVCNGQNLGRACELEIDTDCGRVTAIIAYPESISFFNFRKNSIRIPWDKINSIGKDTVIVELPVNLCSDSGRDDNNCSCKTEKGKKRIPWPFLK